MNIGIYCIKSGNRIYIGQSSNIKERWKLHLKSLDQNKHHCIFLQRHFNKNNTLSFQVLEYCPIDTLDQKETEYWDKYKSLGFEMFNSRPEFGVLRGVYHPNFGKNLPKEHKQNISKANKGMFVGENHPAAIYEYVLRKDGKFYTTKVLNLFCQEHKINQGNMAKCFNRAPSNKSCKGFYPVSRTNLKTGEVETYP